MKSSAAAPRRSSVEEEKEAEGGDTVTREEEEAGELPVAPALLRAAESVTSPARASSSWWRASWWARPARTSEDGEARTGGLSLWLELGGVVG